LKAPFLAKEGPGEISLAVYFVSQSPLGYPG
jgi:hypothetical protein